MTVHALKFLFIFQFGEIVPPTMVSLPTTFPCTSSARPFPCLRSLPTPFHNSSPRKHLLIYAAMSVERAANY